MDFVAFVSWGNDSVALVQWLHENGANGVTCVYSDTGWAAPWWADRVAAGEELAKQYGYATATIQSMGMQRLIQIKKAWPSNQHQFCTAELKVKPALEWLSEHDPEGDAVCVIGVRREESRRRASFPETTPESDGHGGRELWAPLVRVREEERNALIGRAGFDVLPTRSQECYPCVNANRADLRALSEARVAEIERLEAEMGVTAKGKPRVMFRPHRFQGAIGIREVVRWAESKRGQYDPDQMSLCDSGWCGQ